MVANFQIDQPALLEINRKIATMGGGDYHLVKKRASLCSSLCSVCLFLGVRDSSDSRQNKKKGKRGAP